MDAKEYEVLRDEAIALCDHVASTIDFNFEATVVEPPEPGEGSLIGEMREKLIDIAVWIAIEHGAQSEIAARERIEEALRDIDDRAGALVDAI